MQFNWPKVEVHRGVNTLCLFEETQKLPPPVKSSSLKTTFLFRFPSFYPPTFFLTVHTKVIMHKPRGGEFLLERDIIENVSWPKFL